MTRQNKTIAGLVDYRAHDVEQSLDGLGLLHFTESVEPEQKFLGVGLDVLKVGRDPGGELPRCGVLTGLERGGRVGGDYATELKQLGVCFGFLGCHKVLAKGRPITLATAGGLP
jgi:hypothetical protein